MRTQIFDEGRTLLNLLDEHQSAGVDTDLERITIIGFPKITFSGKQEILKLVLRIERLEITTVYHPLSPVDKRPASGNCMMEPGARCEFRRTTDGKCTSDPVDNERCKFNDGHGDDL